MSIKVDERTIINCSHIFFYVRNVDNIVLIVIIIKEMVLKFVMNVIISTRINIKPNIFEEAVNR